MKTKEEIKAKMRSLHDERRQWIRMQNDYNWTNEEKESGSETFGKYQSKEEECMKMISILEWVIQK